MPAGVPVQVKVEVMELPRLTLLGVMLHSIPGDGEAATVKVIEPVNPFTEVRAMVEVPGAPDSRVTEFGVADIAKSFTW